MAGRQKALIGAALALLLSPVAHALEVARLDVALNGDRYVVEFVAQLEATPEAVHAVLTDYAEYPTLDPRIQESRVLGRDRENSVRLYTRMTVSPIQVVSLPTAACFLFSSPRHRGEGQGEGL